MKSCSESSFPCQCLQASYPLSLLSGSVYTALYWVADWSGGAGIGMDAQV